MAYLLKLISLEANNAGADPLPFDSDDTYMKLNGKQIWSGSMDTGKTVHFDDSFVFSFNNLGTISLYDADDWFYGDDDFLGQDNIYGGQYSSTLSLSGGGSQYTLTYAVQPAPVWG